MVLPGASGVFSRLVGDCVSPSPTKPMVVTGEARPFVMTTVNADWAALAGFEPAAFALPARDSVARAAPRATRAIADGRLPVGTISIAILPRLNSIFMCWRGTTA